MRKHLMIAMCVAVATGATLPAETVTIDPSNGVATNVTERFTGEMDLVVNSGSSGGGIVRLNTLNSYSGTTTLGCGTLVAGAMSATGHVSSVGADGLVKVGPGTFRYDGPAGGWTDRPFTNTPDKAHAAIFDISNELTLAGNIQQTLGSFVKTGPGTLHLAASGTNTLGKSSSLTDSTYGQGVRARWVPNANGDSPTVGFRSFYVLEGKVVIGEGGGTYLIGGGNDPSVGGWTVADGEQEKEATLEIVGGNVEFAGWMMQGACNGSTNTTPDRVPQSTVRVKGGRLYTGSSYSLGRNKLGYATFPMHSRPRLEVQGGELYVKGQLVNGDDRGAHSTIEVTGGKVTATKETVTGRCSGSVDTTNTLVVTGTGVLSATGITSLKSGGSCWNVSVTNGGTITATGTSSNSVGVVNFHVASGGMLQVKPYLTYKGTTNIRVEDGGTFSVTKLQNANTSAAVTTVSVTDGGILEADEIQRDNGTLDLFFDGATVKKRSKSRTAFPRANAATMKLGAGGLTFRPIAGSSFVTRCPFTTADGLERDGGLVIDAENNNSTNEFGTLAQEYTGPTVLKKGVLTFADDLGALSPNSDFVWEGGIFLYRAYTGAVPAAQTVKSATFGSAADAPKLVLRMDARSLPLVATDGVAVLGNPTLAVTIFAAGTVSAATTPGGTYPIITAPVSSRAALETLAACSVLESPSATYVRGAPVFAVTDDGTTATLAVTFTRGVEASEPATAADATAVYNTLGGAADDAEVPGSLAVSGLTGADIVGINTNATGCGTVTVSNVSAEFTGKVVTGSGTVVMDSLAWVDDPTRLVLGPGTLKYTGTGETVPGLTLNAGASKQAILDVANDLTLESVLIGTSAFSKTGPGDLVLKGPGAFNLGNTNKGKSQMPGIGVYGDSPADTFQYVTVADGRLIIGEEGGTEAEPYIVLSGGRAVHRAVGLRGRHRRLHGERGERTAGDGGRVCDEQRHVHLQLPAARLLQRLERDVPGRRNACEDHGQRWLPQARHAPGRLRQHADARAEHAGDDDGRRVRDRHAQLPVRARQPGLPALDDLEPVGRRHDLHGVQRRRHRHRRKHHRQQRRVGTGADDAHELHLRRARGDGAEERDGHGDQRARGHRVRDRQHQRRGLCIVRHPLRRRPVARLQYAHRRKRGEEPHAPLPDAAHGPRHV